MIKTLKMIKSMGQMGFLLYFFPDSGTLSTSAVYTALETIQFLSLSCPSVPPISSIKRRENEG
jgi:hypothetical protein